MNLSLEDLPGEIWKDVDFVKGIPIGLYMVSNKGRVKSLAKEWIGGKSMATISKPDSIMSANMDSRGYFCVGLTSKRKRRTGLVHRLVALAFIPNPDNKPEVNHIDGDKHNNNAENLEWCTRSENLKHAYKTGLRVSMIRKNHPMSIEVIDTKTGEKWGCLVDAAEAIGMKYSTLASMLNGNSKNKTSLKYLNRQ